MTAPFKTFALRALGFLLVPLLVVVAAEAWVRAQPNAARYKHAWLADSAASVGTLVLGSSHTYYGICPETLADDAFSLALPSQTLRYDLALLRRYPLPRLHTLVVPLSYFTLHEDLETTSREPHTAARYRIYMDVDEHAAWSRYGFEAAWPAAFREKLRRALRGERMTWSRRGQGLDFRQEENEKPIDNGRERAEANTFADAGEAFRDNVRRLDEIAAWCRARGVRLVLLTTPVSEAFRRHEDATQRKAVDAACRGLLRRYPEIVRLDYSADSRFGAADFHDADHLNTRGAEKLTRLVRESLRRRGLSGRARAAAQVSAGKSRPSRQNAVTLCHTNQT